MKSKNQKNTSSIFLCRLMRCMTLPFSSNGNIASDSENFASSQNEDLKLDNCSQYPLEPTNSHCKNEFQPLLTKREDVDSWLKNHALQ